MPYPNASNITARGITSITGLLQLANDLSGNNLFARMISISSLIVLYGLIYRNGETPKNSIIYSCFVVFLINLLFMSLEMMTAGFAAYPAVLLLLTFFIP